MIRQIEGLQTQFHASSMGFRHGGVLGTAIQPLLSKRRELVWIAPLIIGDGVANHQVVVFCDRRINLDVSFVDNERLRCGKVRLCLGRHKRQEVGGLSRDGTWSPGKR